MGDIVLFQPRKLVLLLAVFSLFIFTPARADEPIKVVYHVMDTESQGMLAMGNIRNHLAR